MPWTARSQSCATAWTSCPKTRTPSSSESQCSKPTASSHCGFRSPIWRRRPRNYKANWRRPGLSSVTWPDDLPGLEHHVRTSAGLTPVAIDEASPALRDLARKADRAATVQADILSDLQRNRLQAQINRYDTLRKQRQQQIATAVTHSKILTDCPDSGDEHAAASTAFRAALYQANQLAEQINSARDDVSNARARLAAADEYCRTHSATDRGRRAGQDRSPPEAPPAHHGCHRRSSPVPGLVHHRSRIQPTSRRHYPVDRRRRRTDRLPHYLCHHRPGRRARAPTRTRPGNTTRLVQQLDHRTSHSAPMALTRPLNPDVPNQTGQQPRYRGQC